ncbi:MAG TPA: OmpA family protein [Bacteroidales bacterium]|nr:OmpA family protein [Bacteroidales bacterium]
MFRLFHIKSMLIFTLCFYLFNLAYPQTFPQNKKKLLKIAQSYFDNEQFDRAIPYFLKLDSLEPNKFETNYYIGACYLNSSFNKTKGIPYLEFALKNGESLLPNVIFYDLATLYHLNYQFDEAIQMLNTFIAKAPKSEVLLNKAESLLKNCKNAKQLQATASNIDIIKLDDKINTENSETTPFISADENQLFFTRTNYQNNSGIEFETKKEIYLATKNTNQEYELKKIPISDEQIKANISLAGISPDGETLFFAIGTENNADLYACKLENGKYGSFIKLPEIINSQYSETSISVSPDGRTYYFSSNRPGGYGGKDLYRAILDDKNEWSVIENLGPSINTEYDEDSPFIHPDNLTLYFSSKGHTSIGGYDIFFSKNIDKNEWEYPVNIGFPINTPGDDIGFVITAEGNNAYFASSKNNINYKYDIYKAILHKTIPLTLVKGIIRGGDPPKPIKAKIRVLDKETQQIIKYVYNPNPNTGKYLMIFPPNKNYDMIIEAENYLPQLVNIYIPNQTYFYELYQEIFLKQVKVNKNDTAIGQEIRISNTFYDIYKTDITDSILNVEQQKRQKHVDELLKLVENIISTTDSISIEQIEKTTSKDSINDKNKVIQNRYNKLLDLVETAIEKTDSTTLQLLDANAIYNDVTNKVFFYGTEPNEQKMSKIIIGSDTLYTLPAINTSKPFEIKTPSVISIKPDSINKPIKKQPDFKNCPEEKRRYVYISYIYYKSGQFEIDNKYFNSLKDIIQLVILNPELGIEINGFADPTGNHEKNIELSKKRSLSVAEYLINKQISPRRIIVNGKGEIGNEKEEDLSQMRRTEIKLFEILQKDE